MGKSNHFYLCTHPHTCIPGRRRAALPATVDRTRRRDYAVGLVQTMALCTAVRRKSWSVYSGAECQPVARALCVQSRPGRWLAALLSSEDCLGHIRPSPRQAEYWLITLEEGLGGTSCV